MDDVRAAFARQGLFRARDERVLGGVCAGLGRRVGLGPWPARILFLVLLMVLPGSQVLVYPALWVLMPVETGAWGSSRYGRPPGS
jgi:phage shock protein C